MSPASILRGHGVDAPVPRAGGGAGVPSVSLPALSGSQVARLCPAQNEQPRALEGWDEAGSSLGISSPTGMACGFARGRQEPQAQTKNLKEPMDMVELARQQTHSSDASGGTDMPACGCAPSHSQSCVRQRHQDRGQGQRVSAPVSPRARKDTEHRPHTGSHRSQPRQQEHENKRKSHESMKSLTGNRALTVPGLRGRRVWRTAC